MFRSMPSLPLRRFALPLSVAALLVLAVSGLPALRSDAPIAQDPGPTLCGDSFSGNCSWS